MILRLNILISLLGLLIAIHAVNANKMDMKRCPKRNGFFPKPGSMCKNYYQCKNFVPVEWKCPKDMHFSEIINKCDWKHNFPCFEKPNSKVCTEANGNFLKPGTSCTYYYDCCNGKPTEKKCPPNKIFDPSKKKCEWKELYICEEDISTANTKTISSTTAVTYSTTKESVETTTEKIEYITTKVPDETTTEEIEYTTTKVPDETTADKIGYSTTKESGENTTGEIEYFTTKETDETQSEEVDYSTTKKSNETTPEEIDYSTTKVSYETNSEEILYSTSKQSEETTSGLLQIKHSTTKESYETNPEEIEYSTTEFDEATSEQDTEFTNTNEESTIRELQQSTASDIDVGITDEEHLTTFDLSQLTNEPNLFCPKRFGYYPHPFDKHKFVGCVDYIPKILSCPDDLIYNHEQKQCVFQE